MNRNRNQSGKFVKETQQDNESRFPQVAYWLSVVILVIPWGNAMIKLCVVDTFVWIDTNCLVANATVWNHLIKRRIDVILAIIKLRNQVLTLFMTIYSDCSLSSTDDVSLEGLRGIGLFLKVSSKRNFSCI